MAQSKKLWDPWQMYDVSPDEMRAIKERAKMREALKAEWTKKYTNPFKGSFSGGYLFDPCVQRYIALRATQAEYFRGTFRSAVVAAVMFVLPVSFLTYACILNEKEKENKFRNGHVTYKDREAKFLC